VSLFAHVEAAPGDPILGLTEQFVADPRPHKVNLGVGIYVDEHGKVPLLDCVREVEQALALTPRQRGYLPIDGLPAYNRATQTLLFGADSPLLAAGRVVTAQTVGGSGALRVAGDLLRQILGAGVKIAISNPSWGNHHVIFRNAGFELLEYRYYDPASKGIDEGGLLADLEALQPGTVVLLHGCCHNPTGVDLDANQWHRVVAVLKERRLLPFVDLAYQGFDRGTERDALAVRLLGEAGVENFVVANSYSKSFSLYGERVGALSIITGSKEEAARVLSQLKRVIRTNYSNPPTHGGAIVAAVLASPELRATWEAELGEMRDRIRAMRNGLVERLKTAGVDRDFSFVNAQRGMFSYSGLTAPQVDRLREEFGIYAVSTGRICVAALNTRNLDVVANAVAAVLK
jgi:aromatic-amino-acid transaminase